VSHHNQGEVRVSGVLRRLGLPDTGRDAELLSGGQSGAAVYRVQRGEEAAILKLTRADAPRHLIEQARREARFYRELAPILPISVPRVIGVSDDADEDVAILLAEETPAPHVDHWSDADFLIVARQLGRLHGAFWDRPDLIPSWVESRPQLLPERQQVAIRRWRSLADHPKFRTLIGARADEFSRLIEHLPALQMRIDPMPQTLCHGDCHAENFLRNERGDLLLADWQQVRRGGGIDDLSFFFQRAFAASERTLPLDAMVRGYTETLVTEFNIAISISRVERCLQVTEFRGWLIDWPEYLGFLPGSSVERILARIDWLNSRLDGARE